MKIITEIKVIKTKDSIHEIAYQAHDPSISFIEFGSEEVGVDIVRELIKGRRFVDTRRGLDLILGCSQEAGDILQLQYDAFKNMDQSIDNLSKEKDDIKRRLNKVLNASFFTRLKYVFTGVKEAAIHGGIK